MSKNVENLNLNEKECEPRIVIKKSSEAPMEVKQNPFYDSEIWGRAKSPEEIYLPDSDEVISFAIAAHEIGHLVKGGFDESRIVNFEATRAEEERAWSAGWPYLEKYLAGYFEDENDREQIMRGYESVRDLMMRATDESREMYLPSGSLESMSTEEYERVVRERREDFFAQKRDKILAIFSEIKRQKIGKKPDWEKFTDVVTKAVRDILKDNHN